MLALAAALAAPIVLMVAMLAVPLVLFIEAERTDTLKVRWRLFWLFGLVKPRSRNRSAPSAPERADAGPASRRRNGGGQPGAWQLRFCGHAASSRESYGCRCAAPSSDARKASIGYDVRVRESGGHGVRVRMPFAGAGDGRPTGTDHPLSSDVPGVGRTSAFRATIRVRPLLVVGPIVAFLVSPPVFRAARVAWRTRK